MTESFRQECLKSVPGRSSPGKCLLIGEVAQTHDGSLGAAHAFIDAIAAAGADAVKFQTHIAEEESTPDEPWRVKFSPKDESRFEYWKRMEFTKDEWRGLKVHADERNLLFLSTPFSERAVEMLDEIGMRVWKVASGEVGNIPLLKRITAKRGPVILSSGMSGWDELDIAVSTIRDAGSPLAVLQCTSSYPCPPEQVGLNVLAALRDRYGVAMGLSDHTGNIFASLAAVTLGAEVVEVHVTLSREMYGPDVPASLTTQELRQLVDGTRQIEQIQAAPVDKDLAAKDLSELRSIFTKSVVASRALPVGTTIAEEDLKLKKPGTGIPARELPQLIGRKIKQAVLANEMLQERHFDA
ncbi:MAG: N-acetylneuraminate synthase family protein [Pyrinomonadaceae bacterium]|nr:N-acetylneuraminate synthase family protein [Pyrinomonadaceae bacterium]